MTKNIKVILFDFDDTLVGTMGPKWKQHKYVAKKYYNKNLTDDEIAQHWGKPFHELVQLIYDTDDFQSAFKYLSESDNRYQKELFHFSFPTLQKIKAKNIKTGIVTGTSQKNLQRDFDLYNITKDFFDYIQTIEDTKVHKPNPDVFEPAKSWLRNQEILDNEVLYVGDGLIDLVAATDAGFNFIGVETGLYSASDFNKAGSKSIKNVGELAKIFS